MFLFLLFVFWCLINKIIAKTSVIKLFPMFLLEVLQFHVCEVFNPFELIFAYSVKIRMKLHSLACGYPVFPISTFVEEIIISPLCILHTLLIS